MDLLVEVQVKNSLPINGTWKVPSLSAVDLIPVLYLLGLDNSVNNTIEWIEESVFRATKSDAGIRLEFPMKVGDFNLLRFCIIRVIDGMISAVLDTAWGMEVYARIEKARGSGVIVPQARAGGPLRL